MYEWDGYQVPVVPPEPMHPPYGSPLPAGISQVRKTRPFFSVIVIQLPPLD
jgi:hypothetical protein